MFLKKGTIRSDFAGRFISSPDRTPALRTLTVPTLVVHGRVDRLVPLSGGEATAAAIPGARLLVLDQMAHDLPPSQLERIATLVIDHARAAQALSPTAAAA